ncbi:MAG: SigE family RNA polymerase sigma factor [Actinobacteria bacterium]|nr:SigE family RNA polymerase sigma factor [Actinomycetota bacterium]
MVVVEVANEGGKRAGGLAELYVRHAPAARSLAFLLAGNRQDAEDLVQEAFVRLAGRFRHLRNRDAFSAYLRRTVVNLHTSRLRRLRLERRSLEREGQTPPAGAMPDVAGREDLWRALGTLPARQRAAIVLRYYEDLTERETADVLRCSVAAAKSLVARGMETLRARLGHEDAREDL